MLSNRSANTMISPSGLGATATNVAPTAPGSMPHQGPISNEHLYSTLYGRELELMRKIYKGDSRDHLVENPLMHSPHQQHNPDPMIMKNAGYSMNYPNPASQLPFGVGLANSQYHHALSPSRTSPKIHHPDQIMSPDNTRMIKQEEKPVLFNSPPSGYTGYGASSMSPTSSILGNMGNPLARKFDTETLHKHLYEDRKLQMNAGFPNKDHHDHGYGDNIYADVMTASNNNVNNFMHLQQEHEKQNQRQQHQQNTTKHNNNNNNNNSQLIGTESNNHFYNISEYESNDKRQQHHSSHQLFQQNQFSINNTLKDNGGVNTTTGSTEKSPINNASKLNNACSHSDSNNNNSNSNNDNAKNVRMTAKFSAASNANENAFENPCRSAKMCTKSIKSDATSKINPNKVNNSNNATNLLSHSKCGNETTNDFMLHIRAKEPKQLLNTNGRMAQQMDFDETSNSCDSPGNEDAGTYNDDEGDEFMNL